MTKMRTYLHNVDRFWNIMLFFRADDTQQRTKGLKGASGTGMNDFNYNSGP